MRIEYDADANALHIRFKAGVSASPADPLAAE